MRITWPFDEQNRSTYSHMGLLNCRMGQTDNLHVGFLNRIMQKNLSRFGVYVDELMMSVND